jgi:hemerythrin-like domain-containing protein
MRPTEILSSEHRVIEQVLDCLEALARRARDEQRLDIERAGVALEILRTFADRCHHGKEEERLFPMLVARGMSTHHGPIAVMLDDHRSGREHVARMAAACTAADVRAFAAAAEGYVALLRDHIAKEDGVLFPMAESMLDEGAREVLLESFRAFEHHDLGAGTHERMLRMADELAAYYGVPLAAERSSAHLASGRCGLGHACH